MKHIIALILLLITACQSSLKDPQQIIDDALLANGSEKLNSAIVEFEFRDREYGVKYDNGKFEMVRIWGDTTNGVFRDVVTNSGFQREINGEVVDVPDSMALKYTSSINSVIYYALLPYRLNDEAVIKKYIGNEEIKGKNYDMIEITFKKEGGGEDYQDVYMYWVNSESHFIDYFCYSYATDGGGIRFREAFNPRNINGVRVVDHNNYEVVIGTDLKDCAKLFENGELNKISVIELKNVLVKSI